MEKHPACPGSGVEDRLRAGVSAIPLAAVRLATVMALNKVEVFDYSSFEYSILALR